MSLRFALKLALHFENARRVLGQIRIRISIHIPKNIFSHVEVIQLVKCGFHSRKQRIILII